MWQIPEKLAHSRQYIAPSRNDGSSETLRTLLPGNKVAALRRRVILGLDVVSGHGAAGRAGGRRVVFRVVVARAGTGGDGDGDVGRGRAAGIVELDPLPAAAVTVVSTVAGLAGLVPEPATVEPVVLDRWGGSGSLGQQDAGAVGPVEPEPPLGTVARR